ncbi:alpha/beta hydrolase [Winogradskyella sp.]|uniref:alpha/beta hydrolase n=1 Tax=Winogradskyella sp. TaxID=1883156 RepID=UPI0025F24011|nr:alpha/beta hydrolase [Winogradskyella sp.]
MLVAFLLTFQSYSQSEIIEEEILIKNDSIQLPGTLTYDKALDKQPLIIYIHGSGKVDRNGNQKDANVSANYIKLLSDSLTIRGIAFYRYDKRTSKMSNLMQLTSMEAIKRELTLDKFVEDAKLAINKFKEDPRFSGVTLIGHSQGSLVAMLASEAGINKYISLAGPAKSFDISLIKQLRLQLSDSIVDIVDNHFKELKATGNIKKVDPDPTISILFSKANLPFIRSWSVYIPTEEIKKVKVPTLILNGTKDNQVLEEDAKALHKAKPDAEFLMIENMNHPLKTVTNDEDNEKSLYSPDFPLSEELISVITEFIKK